MTEKLPQPELRWGILGTGTIANSFIQQIQEAGGVISAIGSRSLENARTLIEQHDLSAQAFGSYDELLASKSVDIVYVATPIATHFEVASQAIRAGIPALVEKSFTYDAEQAKSLLQLAKQERVFIAEAMWTKYLPQYLEIKHLLQEGALGEIKSILTDHGQSVPPDENDLYYNAELKGSVILDIGVYCFSFIEGLLGPATEIAARGKVFRSGNQNLVPLPASSVAAVLPPATPAGAALPVASQTPAAASPSTTALPFVPANSTHINDLVADVELFYPNQVYAHIFTTCEAQTPSRALIIGTKGYIEMDFRFYGVTSWRWVDNVQHIVHEYDPRRKGQDYPWQKDRFGFIYEILEAERCVQGGLLESPLHPGTSIISTQTMMDQARQLVIAGGGQNSE
jgi:predicted dehydrogenase